MRFGSVCSGIEAASVAWEPIGWQAAWFSEIEPFPCAVLAHHYPDVPNHGDMTTLPERILAGEVEAPDLFCGGTPCQAFSVAGLRRSLDDARGNLSLIFCEIADAIDHVRLAGGKPAGIVFWENVPGVLSTADNAFGCFLGALAGCDTAIVPSGRWTDAGVVDGPKRTVAWRVLDAQYFGLAQRRRRVFVVASARDDFDPAQVLLEFEGVRRDTAPSREAGQGTAVCPTLRAGGNSTGGDRPPGTDVDTAESLQVVQPYPVGNTLTARMHKGINSTLDEEQTPVLAHALRGEGFDASKDGTGRGTPLMPVHVPEIAGTMKACKDSGGWSNSADHAAAGYMVPVTVGTLSCNTGPNGHDAGNFACNQAVDAGHVLPVAMRESGQGYWIQDEIAGTLRAEGEDRPSRPSHVIGVPVPMINMQGSKGNAVAQADGPSFTLNAMHGHDMHAVAVPVVHAFDARQSGVIQYGDKSGPLDTDGHTVGVLAFAQNQRDEVRMMDKAGALAAEPGAKQQTYLLQTMQVRRLTPVECERLQGFPDHYTAIQWRGKPASECPDGPRYKALGNSWAVPAVRWIGRRIQSN